MLRERLDDLGLRVRAHPDRVRRRVGDAWTARRASRATRRKCSCASACAASDKAAVERFTREIAPLVLNGPPSVTGFAGGRPKVEEIVAYWPALDRQDRRADGGRGARMKVRLLDIAHARSGDKGDTANVGVIALEPEWYPVLVQRRHARARRAAFRGVITGDVERFELPNLDALNFLLHGALDGGGTLSLKTDAQGKVFSTAMLRMVIDVPDAEAKALGLPGDRARVHGRRRDAYGRDPARVCSSIGRDRVGLRSAHRRRSADEVRLASSPRPSLLRFFASASDTRHRDVPRTDGDRTSSSACPPRRLRALHDAKLTRNVPSDRASRS